MTNLATLREYAREWCEFAAGERGRTVSDPVYQAIVEGRDRGPGYSSCADLAHWLLFRLGCRDAAVNRDENGGWDVGKNVSRLAWWAAAQAWPRPEAVTADALARHLQTGDIVITWRKPDTTDAHVCVFDRVEGVEVHTWDAGQGPMSVAAWSGGKDLIEVRRRVRRPSEFAIRRWISLGDVTFEAEPELPVGEVFDEMEAPTPEKSA